MVISEFKSSTFLLLFNHQKNQGSGSLSQIAAAPCGPDNFKRQAVPPGNTVSIKAWNPWLFRLSKPRMSPNLRHYANSILDFLDLAFTFLVSSLHRASSRLVGCCRAAVLEAFPNAARLPPGPLPREDQWHSAAGPGLKSTRNSFLRRQSWKDINPYPDNPKRNGAL